MYKMILPPAVLKQLKKAVKYTLGCSASDWRLPIKKVYDINNRALCHVQLHIKDGKFNIVATDKNTMFYTPFMWGAGQMTEAVFLPAPLVRSLFKHADIDRHSIGIKQVKDLLVFDVLEGEAHVKSTGLTINLKEQKGMTPLDYERVLPTDTSYGFILDKKRFTKWLKDANNYRKVAGEDEPDSRFELVADSSRTFLSMVFKWRSVRTLSSLYKVDEPYHKARVYINDLAYDDHCNGIVSLLGIWTAIVNDIDADIIKVGFSSKVRPITFKGVNVVTERPAIENIITMPCYML